MHMTKIPPSKVDLLRRLRRNQYLLVSGGGALITLAVMLTCLLELWAVTRGYLDALQDDVSLDARQLSDYKTRVTANVLNNAQSIELALRSAEHVDPQTLESFLLGEQALRVQAGDNAHPLLLIGRHTRGSAQRAWPYLQLAHRLSPLVSIVKERGRSEHSIYLYSRDKAYLLVSEVPWPGERWQQRLISARSQLIERLTIDLEHSDGLPVQADDHSRQGLRWLPPYVSPLTGKQAFRISTSVRDAAGDLFGNVVYELAVENMRRQLSASGTNADYMLFDNAGRLMVSTRGDEDSVLQDAVRKKIEGGLGRTFKRDIQSERILYGVTLAQTGWTLVHALEWRDLASGLGWQLLIPICTAAFIILITWLFLLMIKRRVLAPAVSQSQRVFESEVLSRTLIQTAPVGLALLVIESGEVLLRSPTMQLMQRRVSAEPQQLPSELVQQYRQSLAASEGRIPTQVLHAERAFIAADGDTLNLSISMAPVRYQEQDALVVAFIDVTDKKRLEQSLLDARIASDNANAAKSSFLAAMSHEIRTPLNAILGNLELLNHSALDSQRERLDIIRRSSDTLLSIISDVLDFSKIEAGELRLEHVEFDVLEIATRSLAIFSPAAQSKGLMLFGELSDTMTLPVSGDPTRLQQVLNNLLSNAIKFTEHGHVTLRIQREAGASRIVFEVEDSGIGMTEEQVQQIFRPFTQADDSINRLYGGTGLGLTLCQRLVQAMGGELAVKSTVGQGSLFRFQLPLELATSPAGRPVFRGERIAVVVASSAVRTYLDKVLCAWGLSVSCYQHPVQLDARTLQAADVLVLWGDRISWCAEDENRLIEDASWVIDCDANGPLEPTATGRVLSASTLGLRGLARALEHALQDQPLAAPLHTPPPQWALSRSLSVLVAEDNLVNQRLLEEQLHVLGCTAVVVRDGNQALQQLQRERFDLLLTDLSMPGMDGYTLARRVGEQWPNMPVIAVTANVTLHEKEACKAAGMALVVTKPLSIDALAAALKTVCSVSAGVNMESTQPYPAIQQSQGAGWLGSQALPEDLQRTFDDACLASQQSILQALTAGDTEAILHELHSLRGALGVFHLDDLAQKAEQLDQQVRLLGCVGAADMIGAFCRALDYTVQYRGKEVERVLDRLTELASENGEEQHCMEIRQLCEVLRQRILKSA